MSLTKQLANAITNTLSAEFGTVAGARSVEQMGGGYKVFVDHSGKPEIDATLKRMESRANGIAGRQLTRNELEFKAGRVYF